MGCKGNFDPSNLTLTQEVQLANDNGGSTTKTTRFRIANPSFLLHLTIEVFVRAQNAAGLFAIVGTWSLWSRSSGTSPPEVDLNQLVTASAFSNVTIGGGGDSYEVTTGIKKFRGEMVANGESDGHSVPTAWIVRCTWEPAVPGMSAEEFQRIASACELAPEGALVQL